MPPSSFFSFNAYRNLLLNKFAICFFLLFLGFLGLHPSTYAQSNHCQVNITQHQIAPALQDDFNQRPNQGWVDVLKLPDQSQQHWKNTKYKKFWYKIQWHTSNCNSLQQQPISLVISHINMAGKVYLNEDLLWQDQSLIEPLSRSWNTPRIWSLPATAILPHTNTLWIYVASSATQPATLGQVHLGPSAQVHPYFESYNFKQRHLIIVSLTINVVVGIFYFITWLIYRQEKAYFFFFATIFFWIIYNILFSIQNTSLSSDVFDRFTTWIFSTYTLLGCVSIWRFANLKLVVLEKCLFGIFILNSILIYTVPFAYLTQTIQLIFILCMLIFLARNISYPFLIYKTKQIEVYCLAFVHICYVPVALHDAYQVLTQQTNFWSPYVTPLSTLTIGLLLALRLYRNTKTIETFNQQLSEKIKIATTEREIALNSQHQLALENIRLQERMYLAHDLHDSLGGSLVRSMAMVNQSSQNLSNQQFLSMLKVLRDDLRQLIDSGSSSTHTPPSTPTQWGAAIRYRFVAIFEEMDIHSTWQLPEKWQVQPTAFECLTYLRVIEESLTNVIKHSQAKSVEIHLSEDLQQLILQIKDDGVGFDVNANFFSGMSIGLRSMQVRLEKIGAALEIISNTNGTTIRVIKPLKNLHDVQASA